MRDVLPRSIESQTTAAHHISKEHVIQAPAVTSPPAQDTRALEMSPSQRWRRRTGQPQPATGYLSDHDLGSINAIVFPAPAEYAERTPRGKPTAAKEALPAATMNSRLRPVLTNQPPPPPPVQRQVTEAVKPGLSSGEDDRVTTPARPQWKKDLMRKRERSMRLHSASPLYVTCRRRASA
jgi:hypothetical protein